CPNPWPCPSAAVVDADNRSMRMRAAHGLGKKRMPKPIVRMEGDISCIAGTPGRLHVTVDRPLWTLESRERLASGVVVNLDGAVDLAPGVGVVLAGSPRQQGWSCSGGLPGRGDASRCRGQDRIDLVRIIPASAHD